MEILIDSWVPLVGMLAAMLLMVELGYLLGRRRLRADPEWDRQGVGSLESTVLALLGLMLAFAFSGAWSRFDARRELILRETNAIGTAWLRLDLLPDPSRARLQEAFRRYTDERIAVTLRNETQPDAIETDTQAAIWAEAVTAAKTAGDGRVGQLVLPALNEMFDVATARHFAVTAHPPAVVFVMLIVILLLAVLLAGYGMARSKQRHRLHIGCFVLSLLLAIYVTIDLEYPRRGLVRVDKYDRLLTDLRAGMK